MIELRFDKGALLMVHAPDGVVPPCSFAWDSRTTAWRAPAVAYAEAIRWLMRAKLPYVDSAKGYEAITLEAHQVPASRDYQNEALLAWQRARGRGVVVLPTGAGKSHVALMAMQQKGRSTLVVAPTLELVRQWHELVERTFGQTVGLVGGGSHELRPITITTYDSAYLHGEHIGNRFGLIVFDEVHHLPSESYRLAALATIAPYRLGLTATPERGETLDGIYDDIVGPIVYRKDIVELSGSFLADYDVSRIFVRLTNTEQAEYDAERALFRAFITSQGIDLRGPRGFSEFVMRASRSDAGRRAMAAFRRYRSLAFGATSKLKEIESLLCTHSKERVLLFTQDNQTAYQISELFLIPCITHQTKLRERIDILAKFRSHDYGAIVTSKVLNEGIDVPEASVAIIVSGTGSVREHVQRLGRVLRKGIDKRAVLYELVTEGTSEENTSERRREHSAYR